MKFSITRLAFAATLLMCKPALADWPFPMFVDPSKIQSESLKLFLQVPHFRQLQQMAQEPKHSELGFDAESRGDLQAAAMHYGAAVSAANERPPEWREETLRSTLPRYIRVLMALDRLAEAEAALQLLLSLPPPQVASEGNFGFDEARRTMTAVFAVAMEAAKGMNQRTLFDGDDSELFDKKLEFKLPPTEVPAVLMAELFSRQGRKDDVRQLWQGGFQHYWASRSALKKGTEMLTDDEGVVAAWHMALALHEVGAPEQAGEAIRLAFELDRSRLRLLAGETALLGGQLGGFQKHRHLSVSALQIALKSQDSTHQRFAVGAIAASKSLVNRYLQRRRSLLATLDDRAVQRARQQIIALEQQKLQMPTDGEAGVKAFADWSNQEFAALSPAMPALRKAGLANVIGDGDELLAQIQRSLGAKEALIGFMAYQPLLNLKTDGALPRYVRYTVTAAGVSLRDLGVKKDIDQSVASWRSSSSEPARLQELGRSLSKILQAELPPEVMAATHWVLDPDGMLALLPFEALPDAAGGLLLDRHSVRYVTSMAQLADQQALKNQPAPAGAQLAVVIADPTYPKALLQPLASQPVLLAQGMNWRDMTFLPLPETRVEASAVSAALQSMGVKSRLLMGAEATPAALRQVIAPAFLHVASHGFIVSAAPQGDPQVRNRVRMLEPGLLAGLVLAADGQSPIFTGIDLAAMNLRGTRLVVLSACDTGNGSVDVHEGLTSLRRAAEEAGARATLTSLWPVPSQATVKLMTHFYQQLAAGKSHSEALQSAKLALRAAGGGVRDWAGFLLAGADR